MGLSPIISEPIIDDDVRSSPRLIAISGLGESLASDVERRFVARQEQRQLGPVTGLTKLDDLLGGCLEPGVHVIHGDPGAGKTALALQIAASCGCPALFITCEMRPEELLRRLVARITTTPLSDLRSGKTAPTTFADLSQHTASACPRLWFGDATVAFADRPWICDQVELVKGDQEHVLVLLDTLHSWTAGASCDATEYDLVSQGIESLRSMAGQLGCPFLVVVERNRISQWDHEKLRSGASSRKLEYVPETVWALDRSQARQVCAHGDVHFTLMLAKNRYGPAGQEARVSLSFNGALQRFKSV